MAAEKKKPVSRRMWLIDPIYRKFTSRAFRNLTSGEFYEFFTQMLKNGEHTFQFSNRKIKIDVDESWVEIIEDTIPAFIEITRNPRVLITQEELITNVVQAKRIDSQVVRHLCAHSYLIDAIDEENDEVRPNKILNILKEETWDTYENRFVYTLIKKTYDFVMKRYQDMKESMNDEFGATLKIDSTANSDMENLSIKSEMKIRQIDELFDADSGKKSIFARIQYIYEMLVRLMETRFSKEMQKYQIVRPPLVPTNAIKKNPYLKKCNKLWNFLLTYYDVGYTVQIIEQNPEINEKFEQDIFNNIMFTYIILKGYLEDNRDRALDRNVPARRRTLRPKYIREIVEEIVRDFNLPDVEVRKILIEQLTKEQLMREERSDRYKILEENQRAEMERKRQEEMERLRQQKEKEREKKQLERQKKLEQARLEREKAREAERKAKEKARREAADARRGELFEAEIMGQLESVTARREKRVEAMRQAEEKKSGTGAKPAAKKKPAKKKPAAPKQDAQEKPKTKKSAAPKKAPETEAKPETVQIPVTEEQTAPETQTVPAEQTAPETQAAPEQEVAAAPVSEPADAKADASEQEAPAPAEPVLPDVSAAPAEAAESAEGDASAQEQEEVMAFVREVFESVAAENAQADSEAATAAVPQEMAETAPETAAEQTPASGAAHSGLVRGISNFFRRKR